MQMSSFNDAVCMVVVVAYRGSKQQVKQGDDPVSYRA